MCLAVLIDRGLDLFFRSSSSSSYLFSFQGVSNTETKAIANAVAFLVFADFQPTGLVGLVGLKINIHYYILCKRTLYIGRIKTQCAPSGALESVGSPTVRILYLGK